MNTDTLLIIGHVVVLPDGNEVVRFDIANDEPNFTGKNLPYGTAMGILKALGLHGTSVRNLLDAAQVIAVAAQS
jgi:hypothetical protein